MVKVNVNMLEGNALNYAVAIAEGFSNSSAASIVIMQTYQPSTNWRQGGPIIEREQITLDCRSHHSWEARIWAIHLDNFVDAKYNSTPLIAAMRCYVASKLGEVVDIPDELV
jgi:hypothetical protein